MRIAVATAAAVLWVAGSLAAAGQTTALRNRYNDDLMKMSPSGRSAKLAQVIGHWCIGTRAFFMGLPATGAGAGNAYWSLQCLDGQSYAIQLDPDGKGVAIDCATFNAAGQGKECFKKF